MPRVDMLTTGVGRPTISTTKASILLPNYHAGKGRTIPFPAGYHGVLYLLNVDETQASWQMRFRVTDSDSTELFESGTT